MSLPPFANEPVLELRRAVVREPLAGALAQLDARLPLEVPVLVGGERGGGGDGGGGAAGGGGGGGGGAGAGGATFDSTDPGEPSRVVAHAARGDADDAARAVGVAGEAARDWAARPASERAEVLVRAASILRERRLELAALALREAAKPWPEADADVCEAIDFLEYYARGALELERGPELLQLPGERNEMRLVARGVAAVISPWNFPLAIPAGMTAAALAGGNAVVLKPAEQAPACALALVEALHEAGVPEGALGLVPGLGDVGAALVRDPRVHTIAFTGSVTVGLEIVREAAVTREGQSHVKRVVAEMGGKNCVIVDSDADLDEAVPAIVQSAFAYAGQKCSAAARVLAHESVHEDLLERLAGAVEVLRVGPPEDFATAVPPLIEREARERVEGYVAEASRSGTLAARAEAPGGEGWFVAPALASDVERSSPVLREEVFGPLLTVEPVSSVDAACDAVEELPFALTGGLFSRNPDTVERVAARLPAGNLYVNRAITGAMVARQPFGGNRLSGTGAKAGGPHYLLGFVEPRVLSENTMRHGLVVE